MNTILRHFFIALAFLAGINHVAAQGTAVFPIATNGAASQAGMFAAFNGTNYLVGIQGDGTINSTAITAQLISTNGGLVGPRILTGRTGNIPFVASGGTNFLLLWSDNALVAAGGNDQVYGQFINGSGVPVGGRFTFGPTNEEQDMQAGGGSLLAFDGRNYLAVWDTGGFHDAPSGNVHGALFNQSGSLIVPISITAGTNAELTPTVTFGKTNYLVMWNDVTSGNIDGELISTNGTAGTAFVINQTTTPSYNPCCAAFDGTNFFVVWNKNIGSYTPSTIWNLYGRVVSSSGAFPGNEVAMVTDPNNPVWPSLAFDGSDYLLAWNTGAQSSSSQIVFQYFNPAGNSIGQEFNLFAPQGTNDPIFGGVWFDGTRFEITALLGGATGITNSGFDFTSSTGTYGTFLSTNITTSAAFGYLYITNAGGTTITITGYSGPAAALTIPATINNLPVTSIGTNAFYGNSRLTSVIIPNGVTNIGFEAFANCTSLTAVDFQGNAPRADSTAFIGDNYSTAYYLSGATGWSSPFAGIPVVLSLPNSLQVSLSPAAAIAAGAQWQIDGGPWQSNGVTVSNLASGIHTVTFNTISGWTSPANQTVSANSTWTTTALGAYAQQSLFNFVTNNGTITITGYNGTNKLVTIPSTLNGLQVTTIGQNAFLDSGITGVIIPNGITSIGSGAFYGSSLTSVTIPGSVTSVGNAAFQCGSLTNVIIANGFTTIGREMFNSTSLSSITIPASVTSIGSLAFYQCSELTSAYFLGNPPSTDCTEFTGDNLRVYYLPGTAGWGSTFCGLLTATWGWPVTTGAMGNQFAGVGANATFSIAATGAPPFYYQWYFDSTLLPSQTNMTLQLNSVGTVNAGSYSVVVTNLYGSVTSTPALLIVGIPPSITMQPSSLTNMSGSTATISVTTTGTGPFTYQWLLNGANAPNIITTVAGDGNPFFYGDGGLATNAYLYSPGGVALDAAGNLFIADTENDRIRKVGTNRIITTVAGDGIYGYYGDGGTATNAELRYPTSVAVDTSGSMFIADADNSVIRKVGTNGIITTIAGNGTTGYYGDGGAATNAEFNFPAGVAVDASGNLFIADENNSVIRKVGTNGIIATVAGNGGENIWGDGQAATNVLFYNISGLNVDGSGNLFVADASYQRIFKVGVNGIITTFAGNGGPGSFGGDGGAATSAYLYDPRGEAVDASGNLFIADTGNARVRKVGPNGIITTVAGDGTGGYSGDGEAATNAELNGPVGVAIDDSGNLFIADESNNRIRMVTISTPTLTLNNVGSANAGTYQVIVSSPYGSITSSIATLKVLLPPTISTQPQSLAVVISNNATFSVTATGTAPLIYQWYFSNVPLPGQTNATLQLNSVGTINAGSYGVVVTNNYGVVTSALAGLSVGSAPAITMQPTNQTALYGTTVALSVTASGTGPLTYQWIMDGTNLPHIAVITTVAGDGSYGFYGDGGLATKAELSGPSGIAVDAFGNLYIADYWNLRIREVLANGIIATVAGDGGEGFTGDGGMATNASMYYPSGVAVDTSGNMYIVDYDNNRIRKVGSNEIITTVAGDGSYGYYGDGGVATNAELKLNDPDGVAVDALDNLFIADAGNERIRKVGTNGIITTVAGNGNSGFSGDGGLATNAELNDPDGVAVDASGNLFIADHNNQRIRKVGTNGIIATVAGNALYSFGGYPGGFSGDGFAATNAELNGPEGIAVDAFENLFIADTENERIREVWANGIINTVAGDGGESILGDGGAATNANLYYPSAVAVDASGNLFIADDNDYRIRKVPLSPATQILNNVGYSNAGTYQVIVSSPYGSITSSIVKLTVVLFSLSTPHTVAATNFLFQLSGPAGTNYVLQSSTNLVNWTSFSTSSIPPSGIAILTNAISGVNHRFFRVSSQ